MCECNQLSDAIYLELLPSTFYNTLTEQEVGDWVRLFRCSDCEQLWRIDEWDKYQNQIAIKIPTTREWELFDSSAHVKQLILQSRGGETNEICRMARCNRAAVMGVAFCIDHLYDTGARK
jgi:hypothetical protein